MLSDRIMPIDNIPDWEMRLKRQDAFWECEIIDRPVAHIVLPKPGSECKWPGPKSYSNPRERWMDTDYQTECALARVANTQYLGDALPCAWPNLGPEVFSAFFGSRLEYTDDTSWSVPLIKDWADIDKAEFSTDNFYWKKIAEMTDSLLDAGKGKFYTGMTDLHPGGDAIAAFRDPQQLSIDLIDSPDDVRKLLDYITDTCLWIYDYYHNKLANAGQAISTWCGIVSTKRWYAPSNDFSCMISKSMFDEIFLPAITAECRHLEASIYHLDGPNALRHLDSLLEISELNAIQWVPGAGNISETRWLEVYKKCQSAGKGLQIAIDANELDFWMENLRPEGLWLTISGVNDSEQGQAVLDKLLRWK